MGGKQQKVGATRISANGYHYTKVADNTGTDAKNNWRLTHHIVAEKKLGRPLRPNERVVFVDKSNRLNLSPDNIEVVPQRPKTQGKTVAAIRAKIEDLQAQLIELGEEL